MNTTKLRKVISYRMRIRDMVAKFEKLFEETILNRIDNVMFDCILSDGEPITSYELYMSLGLLNPSIRFNDQNVGEEGQGFANNLIREYKEEIILYLLHNGDPYRGSNGDINCGKTRYREIKLKYK